MCSLTFEQTLEEMEFVFVNDCTPDSSMVILREIIKEYPNRARQNKNSGSTIRIRVQQLREIQD